MWFDEQHSLPGHPTPSRLRRRTGRVAAAVVCGVLITAVTAGGATAASPSPASTRPSLVAVTRDGEVHGAATSTAREFLGIPYAAPPVGPLRWQPPHPVASWQGARPATEFAAHCAQPASPFGVASTSEDCLYLNVYTPLRMQDTRHRLPVIVWIHGGAFNWGESNDYNPTALVNHGVIVVTINYRLGALGFLAHPALAATQDGTSGNYGLMDQQAALRWVHTNITHFGGNPAAVTITGESSGGLSVLAQLASSGAHGLFTKAIAESGSYGLNPVALAIAETAGTTFAATAGCAGQTLTCLDALPVSTILADENPAGYRPDIDGRVLTQTLTQSFASGQFNHVPIINGSNRDEYRLFVALSEPRTGPVTAANYEAFIAATLGVPAAAASAIAAQYPVAAYANPPLALAAVGTDAIFACPTLAADNSLSMYVPTYAYEFNDVNAPERYLPPVDFPYGATHESEVQYLFGLSNTPYPGVLTAPQQQLALQMRDYWTSFAQGKFSASAHQPHWPKFHAGINRILSLNTPASAIETTFATEHHCGFWTPAT